MKIALHLARTSRIVLTAVLLLAALGLTVARVWLLPEVDAYRQSLQAGLAEKLGQPLRIGGLSAHMRGFYPELVLHDVAVVDAASGSIDAWLGQVHVGLDLPHWLSRGEWRTGWVILQGADLSLRRRADGDIVLDGIRSEGTGMPPWLFGYGRFELQGCRLRWRDEAAGGASMDFSLVDLAIANAGDRHHLAIDLTPADSWAGRLRLIADVDGAVEKIEQLAGRIFIQGWRVRPAAWPLPELGGYAVRSGTADFRLWADWRDGKLGQLAGWLALAQPSLVRHNAQLALAGLDGWFRWRRAGDGWSLEATGFKPNLHGAPWPESRFSLAQHNGKLTAAAEYVRLDDVNTLAHTMTSLAPAEGLATLSGLGLRGELRDLNLAYNGTPDGPSHYSLCARFQGVGMNTQAAWPGLTGLSGSVCGDEQQARVDLAAGPGQIDLTRWFRAPLEYTRLEGPLQWRHQDESWTLSGENLRLETPHGALTNHFRLSMPSVDSSPVLDWRAQILGGDMRGIFHYLPVHIMPESTVAWLDAAFLAGRILGGEARLQGPLAAYPFPAGEGIFQVRVDVAEAELHYAKGWQPLTAFSGQLLFEGDGLEVRDGLGHLGETQVADLAVRIDHMRPDGLLSLAGRVEGGLPQVLDYFAHTPKAGVIEKLREHMEMDGRTSIDLLLGYDFAANEDDAVRVRGEVRLADGRVRLPASGLLLESLAGGVRFEDTRIVTDKLQAHVLGAPASLNLSSDGQALRIAVDSRASVQKLGEWQPAEAWSRLKGSVGYRAELTLPQDFKNPHREPAFNLDGDLAAASIDLPPPLGKAAGTPGHLRLDVGGDAQGALALRANYSDIAKLQTRLAKDADGRWSAETGELVLGEMPLGKLPAQGWRIAGKLGAVPLQAWWERLAEHPTAVAYGGKIRQVEMAVAQPSWSGRELGATSLNLNRKPEGWEGTVESAFASGNLRLPPAWPSDVPVALDLERIVLPSKSAWNGWSREAPERERTGAAQLDPARLPTLGLHSRHLLWQGRDLGRLDCALERQPAGVRLKSCALASDLQQTDVEGEWLRSDGKDFSRVNGKIKIKDLGKLLQQLGLGDEVVDTPAKLKFALQWQEAPQRVAASRLNGEVEVHLNQGRLRHVEPGVGRALGLFNIETLKRRLLLDFSDVFDEGLAYDSVRGEFKITGGVAAAHNLLIDGPAARIFVSGTTDLASHALDQLITVMPRTSLAWPILGTLAGGPAVGAAVLLAQQLVGEKLEGITASQYAVRGSWDDPTIVLLSRNTPVQVLQRAWQGVKDLSGIAEPEESKE